MMHKPKILLVDREEAFTALMVESAKNSSVEFLVTNEQKRAQIEIADKKKNFLAAIIINSSISESYSVSLIRFAKAHRPATPIYLICDSADKVPSKELEKNLHLHSVFCKPIKMQDLVNHVFPYSYFEVEKLVELSKKDQNAVDTEIATADGEMHPIRAKDFLCGSKSFFDVYIRVNAGKFIKLLKAGDSFDAQRVQGYLLKGVEYFYIKKEAQELFLQYCDKVTQLVVENKKLDVEVKTGFVINMGKETVDFLKARGVNELTLQAANQFVHHSNLLVQQLKPEKNNILKQFLKNAALCDHGTGTSMIVGMMLSELGYTDSKVVEVIGLSAFLHDIGLIGMPEKFLEENEEEMTPEELKKYHEHPARGAEMARGIRLINPIVPQTILQHHERRTRKGFPNKVGSGAISQVSELVAIADTFNQLIKRASIDKNIDPLAIMERSIFDDFSYPVIEAFQKVFSINAKKGRNSAA